VIPEYDYSYYQHQVPGGMMSTLKRQLAEAGKEFPQPSLGELRRQLGIGPSVSDEELLRPYVLPEKEVDDMFTAGPINTGFP
jgi:hypothetical protein